MGGGPRIESVDDDISLGGDVSIGIDVTNALLPPARDDLRLIPRKVLESRPGPAASGETVALLLGASYRVSDSAVIEDLADDLLLEKACEAVGVVNADGAPVGIIVKEALLAMLGRPYGRDVLRKHPVSEVMEPARTFFQDEYIISVAEEVEDEVQDRETIHFLVVAKGGRFVGTFSTRDILLHLYDRTTRDIALARLIQERIVAERSSGSLGHLSFASVSRMAKAVGGDFCHYRALGATSWIAMLCDVSGKGIAASLVTSVLGGVFGFYDFTEGLAPFVEHLNGFFHRTFAPDRFATGVFLEVEESTGLVSWCDMGHSYAYVYRSGKLLSLGSDTGNPPVGVVESLTPIFRSFRLRSGDLLLVVTDGVIEQRNPEGEEYGISRFSRSIAASASLGASDLADALFRDLDAWAGGVPQHDDSTALVLRYGQ